MSPEIQVDIASMVRRDLHKYVRALDGLQSKYPVGAIENDEITTSQRRNHGWIDDGRLLTEPID
jgi:hypothetical protein